MIPELEIIQLRRFAAIVEAGTFVEAARRLNITQQALSASMARMEDSAGVRFLERRRGSTIELTASGRLLLARARTYLAMSDRLMTEIAQLRDARGGTATLAVGETMTGRRVATAIRKFQESRPDVQLRLIEGYTEQFVDGLLRGEIDFVIGSTSHDLAGNDELEFRYLFEVNDVIAVRRGHPLADRATVSLQDLSSVGWIVPGFRGDTLKAVKHAYVTAGLPPPTRIIQSDAIALGTWLCLDGDYVVVVSPDLVSVLREFGIVAVLNAPEPRLVRHASVITRRYARLSPPAAALLAHILRSIDAPHHLLPEGD